MTTIAATATDTAIPMGTIPASLGIQLKNHCGDSDSIDAAAATGVGFIRRGIYFDQVHPEAGHFDFSATDHLVDDAERSGLKLIGCLFGTNSAFEDNGRGGIQTEAGRQAFADFAAAVAERYADKAIYWEVWNEPNVRSFWRKDGMHNSEPFAEEYVALVKAVVPAMRAKDPCCVVLAGSVSNFWQPSYEWTEHCFRLGVADSGISGWSVHPYGVKRPEDFATGYAITREIMARYGVALPLLNTERGFALGKHFEGWSGGDEAKAADFQAWHVARQFLIDQLCDVRCTIWYEWTAKPGAKDDFGLVDPHGHPRDSHRAITTIVSQLGGLRFARRLDLGNELDFGLLFEDGAGAARLACWTAPPEGGTPEDFVTHDLLLPLALDAVPTAVSATGEAVAVTAAVGALVIPLSGKPVYVDVSGVDMTSVG